MLTEYAKKEFEYAKKEFEDAESDDDKSKLVFLYFGKAVCSSQFLEQTFHDMIIVWKCKNENDITLDFFDNFYEKLVKSKDTMGKLLGKVKEMYSISKAHIDVLSKLLKQRNDLIHGYYKKNILKLTTNEGKLEVILELACFIQITMIMKNELDIYYSKYLEDFGINEQFMVDFFEKKKEQEINKRKNGG